MESGAERVLRVQTTFHVADEAQGQAVAAKLIDRAHELANSPECECDVDVSVEWVAAGGSRGSRRRAERRRGRRPIEDPPASIPPRDSVPVAMLKLRRAIVLDAGSPGSGPEQQLVIELDGHSRPALADVALVGRAQVGDEVIVNTQALDLGLGSGGFDIVHVNLSRGLEGGEAQDPAHRAAGENVMKLNYTSLQHTVAAGRGALVLGAGAARSARRSARSPCSPCMVSSRRSPGRSRRPSRTAASGTCRPWAARCPAGTRARFAPCASAACWPGI